jgi:hypothetical protein
MTGGGMQRGSSGFEPEVPEPPAELPSYNPVYLATVENGTRETSRSSRAVAWLMDELISIPGTRIRFGLDPIIGLFSALGIPVGDALANVVSSVSLVEAIRKGLPFRSTLRILGNILLNAGGGSVPVAGDLFSFLFRSNSRNRDVIESYLASAEAVGRKPSWWRVAGSLVALVVTMLLAVLVCLLVYVYVTSKIWGLLGTEVQTIFGPG